jgi:hypothetical protein
MCTLIVGVSVVAPGTVILGANRDEDPARPSDPPGVLRERPRVIGGRDRRAGGTWLAVRERRAVVALLNRRDPAGAPGVRSRGLLTLEAAAAPELESAPREGTMAALPANATPLARGVLAFATEALRRDRYAPFSLVFASPGICWLLVNDGGPAPRVLVIPQGWHVLTHTELDDPQEPRAARLLRELEGARPRDADEADALLAERLREHGNGAAVCIHEGRMQTVSSTRVWLSGAEARLAHVEGRPCEHAAADRSALLAGPQTAERR